MFGMQLKELRESTGLNQVEFGKRLNVSKQCISNWENNNIQPSIDMVVKIANTFSVTADYLLELDKQRTVDVTGLTNEEIFHIQAIINALRDKKSRNQTS